VNPRRLNTVSSLTIAVVGCLHLFNQNLHSSGLIATDSPTNYTSETWTNGANHGYGFTPWEFQFTAPKTIPSVELFSVDQGNFAPSVTWNVMSTTNGTSSAFRGFRSLEVGEQIYTKFKIDSVSDLASRVGFRLYQNTNLLYFVQYEDENNRWVFNGTMSWSGTNLLRVTEFIWGRSAANEIDIQMRYDGTNAMSVYGAYWTSGYPDRIEIFSEYQGIDTGGLALLEMNAPAVPEPSVKYLIVVAMPIAAAMFAPRHRACRLRRRVI